MLYYVFVDLEKAFDIVPRDGEMGERDGEMGFEESGCGSSKQLWHCIQRLAL